MNMSSITNVTDLLNQLQLPNATNIYRGQCKQLDWPLLPSIARLPKKFIHGYEGLKILEDNLISNFKRLSLPYVISKPQNNLEWLILARNHGLPTRILDFTTNPLKALFFSVENPKYDKSDGVLWTLGVSSWNKEYEPVLKMINTNIKESICVYVPPYDNLRVLAQESIYVLFTLTESSRSIKPLETPKIYSDDISSPSYFLIPKESKKTLRKELFSLGISHMSLFPGLDSVAKIILENDDMLF